MAGTGRILAENYAGFLATATATELAALRALPWQAEPVPGEAVAAQFDAEIGLTAITGAMPFLETPKMAAKPEGDGWQYLKSEPLGHFLVENRALFRAYAHEAGKQKCAIVGDYEPAYLAHVTTNVAGMEAANFAIFAAAQILAERGGRTLLIDADTQGQFVFPLLSLPKAPDVLTESLQKPSSFRADLNRCIVPLGKDFDYLNLQAPSLRPFSEDELCRILGYLDGDFENIIVYAGKLRSKWLSANAHINFAVGEPTYKGELESILRHRDGSHTALITKGKQPYFPCLGGEFSTKKPVGFWLNPPHELLAVNKFVRLIAGTNRIAIGGAGQSVGFLSCYTGLNLYLRYADMSDKKPEDVLARLQGRLRAYYPKSAFFSTRSIYRNIANLPNVAVTTLLEVGDYPQLVSLLRSAELRATAVFPAGILRPLLVDGVRLSAVSADGLSHFRDRAQRGGYDRVVSVPRIKLKNPNALGAIMEQVQA
ncbi:MAG: hypothetical protein U1F27_16445 [Turneriella sp.]